VAITVLVLDPLPTTVPGVMVMFMGPATGPAIKGIVTLSLTLSTVAVTMLEQLRSLGQSLNPELYPQNPLAKAVAYALEREAGLRIYLGDPDVPIDTNHLERALRPIPMGRKNWLFNWTEVGARYVGVIQGLIVTCRLHDINPYTYLIDVLQRISNHPAYRVEELTPRLWKDTFAHQPLRSDADIVNNVLK